MKLSISLNAISQNLQRPTLSLKSNFNWIVMWKTHYKLKNQENQTIQELNNQVTILWKGKEVDKVLSNKKANKCEITQNKINPQLC